MGEVPRTIAPGLQTQAAPPGRRGRFRVTWLVLQGRPPRRLPDRFPWPPPAGVPVHVPLPEPLPSRRRDLVASPDPLPFAFPFAFPLALALLLPDCAPFVVSLFLEPTCAGEPFPVPSAGPTP